jgi:hypothetical protein
MHELPVCMGGYWSGCSMKSPSRSPDWVCARVRRAGISEWRPGGRGTLLAEPVLVCLSSMLWNRRGEIYDQHGKLLASAKARHTDNHSRVAQRGPSTVELLDTSGQPKLSLSRERGRWGVTQLVKATAPDGKEIGAVIAARKERGSIVVAGTTVGCLKPVPGLFNSFGTGRDRNRYTLSDADDNEFGRITYRRIGLYRACCVLEIDARASETMRALALAASDVVNDWQEPKGGGG